MNTQGPAPTREEIYNSVSSILSTSLIIPEEEIRPESRIVMDLGADSVDGMDILYRLEGQFDLMESNFGREIIEETFPRPSQVEKLGNKRIVTVNNLVDRIFAYYSRPGN